MRGDRPPTQEQPTTQYAPSSTNNRPATSENRESDNADYAAAATLHADMPLTAARFPVTIHPRLQQALPRPMTMTSRSRMAKSANNSRNQINL